MASNWMKIPCPYCELVEQHKGDCVLSMMRTGKFMLVVAVPVDVAGASAEQFDVKD